MTKQIICPLCGSNLFKIKYGYACVECNSEFDELGNRIGDHYPDDITDYDVMDEDPYWEYSFGSGLDEER